jgi:hypothetical protein
MKDIAGIPFDWARFDKDGHPQNDPKIPADTTDLIVVSHGWKNTEPDATALYTQLFTNLAEVTKADPDYAARKLAIIGVLWPAKQFDLAMTNIAASGTKAGGTLSAGSPAAADSEKAMQEAIDRAATFFDEPGEVEEIAKLRTLTERLEKNEKGAKEEFVAALRRMLDPKGQAAAMKSDDDGSKKFFVGNAERIFDQAKQAAPASTQDSTAPVVAKNPNAPVGSASGQEASFFGDLVSGAANSVANLLNLTTYFKMKIRAGTVGSKGVAPLINRLGEQVQRVHLVGHSFGGRLVTAAAADSTTKKIHSLSLLQAAFSHNGFSRTREGFFRKVVDGKRVNGPILITHTKNDRAVGLAYPAASRISGDRILGFGDADDEFGGIGSNGAQQMDKDEIFAGAKTLVEVKGAYDFKAGKLHNLESSKFIVDPTNPKHDAHGFIYVPQVAWAISRAFVSA